MKQPLASIITPCYNGEKFVSRFLDSVLAQTYKNIELIIINDGSTDKTEEIILSYKTEFEARGIQFIYLWQKNKGQAAALNQGLKIFKGKYFTWPDSDDILIESSIEKKVKFLQENSNYEMVRSNGSIYNEKSEKTISLSESKNRFNENIFEDLFLERTFISCGCYMLKAKLFYQCYPKKMIFESREGQNYQLLLPASSKTKCGFIDENLYCIVERENSHSRKTRTLDEHLTRLKSIKRILDETFSISDCDLIDCKNKVDKFYAYKRLKLAYEYNNVKIFNKEYFLLKQNKQLNTKAVLLNLTLRYPCLQLLFKMRKKIIKILKGNR